MKRMIALLALVAALPAMAQTVAPTEARLEWDYAATNVTFVLERKPETCSPSGTWIGFNND
ncbi:MAG: hypothetical protein OEW90_00940 [Betaproteobacteria bacterium]|nr:hypothetical protein [Betaproteobacteria bacterium]MDH4322683.1 hypothetical protein [Betaproteobacteria bacterium]